MHQKAREVRAQASFLTSRRATTEVMMKMLSTTRMKGIQNMRMKMTPPTWLKQMAVEPPQALKLRYTIPNLRAVVAAHP